MASSHEYKEAQDLLRLADAKASSKGSSSFFSLFSSSRPNYDEVSSLYVQAGNAFKAARFFAESGEAYLKAADMDLKAGEPDEAARKYVMASNSFKMTDPSRAIDAMKAAIHLLVKSGRFHIAAQHEREVAEIYEQAGNLPAAVEWYERAADRYSAENSPAIAQNCSLKAAQYSALTGGLPRAWTVYESAATSSVSDALQRFSVRDYLFKAGLCRLAAGDADLVDTQRAIAHYAALDPSFAATREHKLLASIHDALVEDDAERFTAELAEFDKVHSLDDWKTKILLMVKARFEAEPDLT